MPFPLVFLSVFFVANVFSSQNIAAFCNELEKMAHANILMAIRCHTCQKPVGHLWAEWQQRRLQKGNAPADVRKDLDEFGLVRDCCRQMLLTHTEPTAMKETGNLVRPAKHMRKKPSST